MLCPKRRKRRNVIVIYTQLDSHLQLHLVSTHHQVRNVIQILQHLATHLFGRRRIRVDVREDSADGKAETQLGLTNSATGAFWRLLPHLAVASWFGIILSFVFFFSVHTTTFDTRAGFHLIGRRATPATRQPLLQRRSRHQRISTYCQSTRRTIIRTVTLPSSAAGTEYCSPPSVGCATQ